jgi:hypothetical protein
MSFTWRELVCYGMIKKIGEPELVRYFLDILLPLRRDFIEDEARKYHCSLRVSVETRWKVTREFKENGLYHLVNSMVPIRCRLPFTNRMWKISSRCMINILYFRMGFMRVQRDIGYDILVNFEQTKEEKIMCINRIMRFSEIRIKDYEEILFDYLLFSDEGDLEDIPYILLTYSSDGQPHMDIIN